MLECLPDNEALCLWLTHYGSFALFGLLALGIIALPVPEETLMVLAGILIGNGKLEVVPTIFAAYAGSICGITVSYLVGRSFGRLFIEKYGAWFGITEARLQKVHVWFEVYGKWTLMFGYFIPGVRHFTGFCAGTSSLAYPPFALFAYIGGIIWVSTFLSIGYFVGDHWKVIYAQIEAVADKLVLFGAFIVLVYILYRIFYVKKATKQ